MKRWQKWGLELTLALLLFVVLDQWRARELLDSGVEAPPATLVTLDQQTAELIPVGKPTLVYFFAPWCSVCKLSIGNLQTLQGRYPELAIRMVALDYSSLAEVSDFIEDRELAFPVLMGNSAIAQRWQIKAYPTYYLIDAKGQIVSRNMGYSTELGMKVRLELM